MVSGSVEPEARKSPPFKACIILMQQFFLGEAILEDSLIFLSNQTWMSIDSGIDGHCEPGEFYQEICVSEDPATHLKSAW
jgi:hypothetical protein